MAEFGDLDELAGAYADDVVGRQARRTSIVLTAGYLLVLAAWAVLGLLSPVQPHPDGREWAANSFGVIGLLAVAVTAAVSTASRRRARAGQGASALAWLAGAAGVGCAVATLVASYLVHPWGAERDQSVPVATGTGPVEVLSALVTFTILALSLRCLWSAGRAARHHRPTSAGGAPGVKPPAGRLWSGRRARVARRRRAPQVVVGVDQGFGEEGVESSAEARA